eukprot:CAMPEP_0116075010 /NCGR_PEP_ID=MMETSP0322-20121206/16368_1 /TAXON_ID=163516 /ORGANISM="Leptocylindrus danicus var. apora, Strain B651" /LENGTH=600 /DNA_ID=CAMNT_0003564963 /DNA_START=85 /DNA_END=1888 /DNA_ORIENTATION=+
MMVKQLGGVIQFSSIAWLYAAITLLVDDGTFHSADGYMMQSRSNFSHMRQSSSTILFAGAPTSPSKRERNEVVTLEVNDEDAEAFAIPMNIEEGDMDSSPFALDLNGDKDGKFSKGNDGGFSQFVQEKIMLGITPTPEIIAIMTIYFVQGALGLARLAQTFLLKDELHLGPAEMSALSGFFVLPWTVKPLYGFLSDGVPLFGYRRRSYLILAGLLGCLSYLAVGNNFFGFFDTAAVDPSSVAAAAGASAKIKATVAALLLGSGTVALSDVVADGIVVQRTREASDDPSLAGGLQSLCWGSSSIGGLLSAYFSGSLLEVMGPRDVFTITAAMPLLVGSIALLIDEKKITFPSLNDDDYKTREDTVEIDELNVTSNMKNQFQLLLQAFKEPSIWKPCLFIFLWQSTPTSDGAMLYFMTNDLGMGPEFLGRVRLVTAIAALVGVWGYQQFLRRVAIKDILFWTTIASAPLGLSQLLLISHANRSLGIPDEAFVFGDDVALTVFGEFAFLPLLVLAARLCPPGIEAVMFGTLMSLFNFSGTVGTEVGAALTKYLGVTESNFEKLGLLTTICSLSSLYPLVFLGWIDDVGATGEDDEFSVESDVA